MITTAARFRGCLIGLAAGDAVGTTVEFQPPGTFVPLTDMVGGGPFGLPCGAWTDDTSMALCLATSLVEKGAFDPQDQMERYWRWYTEGYLSSIGRCFDIGAATRAALERYRRTGDPFSGSTDPYAAGNGSIMRLAPVVMFGFPAAATAVELAAASSRTTHAALEAVDACRLLAAMLVKALAGAEKEAILFGPHFPFDPAPQLAPKIQAMADGSYRSLPATAVRGSGYVVESLQAALWCFWRTDSYRDAVLAAANLGDDADTTAAVCGQLAGAFYGEAGIPLEWRDKLLLRSEIETLADRLSERRRA